MPAPRKVSTTLGRVVAPYAGRGGFARTFGTFVRSDVPLSLTSQRAARRCATSGQSADWRRQ